MKGIMSSSARGLACWALRLVVALSLSAPCEAGWVNNHAGGMPYDAMGIGNQYTCRAYHGNDVQPGYAYSNDSVCHFSYGGLEMTSNNFDWYTPTWAVASDSATPPKAIAFGSEMTANGSAWRYVCRYGLTPGEYGADLGGCTFPYGGVEYGVTQNFQVLVDPMDNPGWPPGSSPTDPVGTTRRDFGPYFAVEPYPGYFPSNAIVAGRDTDGSLLYMCIAFYQDGYQPGKTRKDWNSCDIGWGGAEHFVTEEYSVLVPNYDFVLNRDVSSPTECEYGNGNGDFSCYLNPIPVGVDSDGSTLYSCIAYVGDGADFQMILGKTRSGWNACSYAMNGVENWYPFGSMVLTDGLIYAHDIE